MGIVDTAKSYINKVVYKFGADNVDGGVGDCSSFTKTVYEKNGISIGRDTETQWTQGGARIDKSALQAGDLVFFKDTYQSGHTDGVSHVGIYEGNGKFIHNSSGAGGVVEADLNSSFWTEHYLGAKRFGSGSDVASVSEGSSGSEGATAVGLTWWGDIVNVVLITLLCVAGVGLCVLAFKS